MSYRLRREIEKWRRSEPRRYTDREWVLLEWLADFANDQSRQCWPSAEKLMERTAFSRATIFRFLHRFEVDGVVEISRRRLRQRQTSNLYTIVTTSQGLTVNSEKASSGSQMANSERLTATRNPHREPHGRARDGTGEAPAPSFPVPVGQRAPAHPARHPAHRNGRFVEDARPRKRASLRSGRRPSLPSGPAPAPAPAQAFDIEEWTPTSEQTITLQTVRPDLDSEIVEEQLVAFRVWARDKRLRFRDRDECLRRFSGFLRLTHVHKPSGAKRAARQKGSAGAERAAPAKPKGKNKRARRSAEKPAPLERASPAKLSEHERGELEQLAESVGCRLTIRSADDIDVHYKLGGTGKEYTAQAAMRYLREQLAAQQRRQEWRALEELAKATGCRLNPSGSTVQVFDRETGTALTSRGSRPEAEAFLRSRLASG